MNRRDRRSAAAQQRRSVDRPSRRRARPADPPAARGIERERADQRIATLGLLAQSKTAEGVVRSSARAHVYAQTLSDPVFAQDERIACREGCSWCCHLRVSSTPLEVLGIVEWLRGKLSEEELERVCRRARVLAAETAGMTREQRPPRPCPLLENNRCLAYEARPLTCRGWHSFDVAPCRSYVEGKRDAVVDVNASLVLLSQSILAGIQDAARERALDGSTVDFALALSLALETPAAMTRWLDGDAVFEPAHIASDARSVQKRLPVLR